MVIVGYKEVKFTNKDSGELVEYVEVYLGNKPDEVKKEYGIQIERVTMGKKIYQEYDLKTMMDEKIQVLPNYNKYGKCQGLMKV